ncbi:Multidrug resistance-associated protein 1 [Mortierella polycephala]|uniref:Multidrug resistance-associated protein 1 n=1 Tax=Mortierella polycephala TaxID=41804 RepID=A0A9P6U5Z4_9FUNG|nr:Multidrug resistance-associated protein 1 [Mortierella polycephala]
MSAAWLCALILNYNERKYSIQSSSLLVIFHMVPIMIATINFHTLFDLGLTKLLEYDRTITFIGCLTLGFVIETWPRGSTRAQQQSGAQEYEKVNLFSQLSFYFFQPIISFTARQQMLQPLDVVNQLPEPHRTEQGYDRLSAQWNQCVQRFNDKISAVINANGHTANSDEVKKSKEPSLMATILFTHWSQYELRFHSQRRNGGREVIDVWSGTIFATKITLPILYAYVLRHMCLIDIEIKASLIAIIYRKTLKLSPDARRQSSTGAITNYMSVDAALWEEGIDHLSICYLISHYVSFCLREERLKTTDEREHLTPEVLSNIKIVKLYGWETAFKDKSLAARRLELKVLKHMGAVEATMTLVFALSSIIVSLITFAVYVTIVLYNRTTSTISLIVATKRIQRFLLREEIDEAQILREKHSEANIENVVEIRDTVLAWTLGSPPDEEGDEEDDDHDNLREDPGQRFETLTSESGTGHWPRPLDMSSLLNATLKENIVFRNSFDLDRYRKVLKVCGLEPDLEVLPVGDMTKIGERGFNLSGGQKQRVSLADSLIGPKGLLKDKARILVIHKIRHLEDVNQIVTMKDDEIVEMGQYDEHLTGRQLLYQRW